MIFMASRRFKFFPIISDDFGKFRQFWPKLRPTQIGPYRIGVCGWLRFERVWPAIRSEPLSPRYNENASVATFIFSRVSSPNFFALACSTTTIDRSLCFLDADDCRLFLSPSLDADDFLFRSLHINDFLSPSQRRGRTLLLR